MANQFFEVGGLRIDLGKVVGWTRRGVPDGSVTVELSRHSFAPSAVIPPESADEFVNALDAYRESLKPKYQFKDGWYICNISTKIRPSLILRYIISDHAWSADGVSQMSAKRYESVTWVDIQPPPPSTFED